MKKLLGFTLIEVLIVLVIIAILFVLMINAVNGVQESFVSNQTLKEVLVQTRSARRQSMLITKKVGEAWVHGVGVEIVYNSTSKQWQYTTVQVQYKGTSATHCTVDGDYNRNLKEFGGFYVPYPVNQTNFKNCYEFSKKGNTTITNPLINFTYFKASNPKQQYTKCSDAFRIVFMSINGKPRFYCGLNEVAASDLTGGLVLGNKTTNYKIIIGNDGNISALGL